MATGMEGEEKMFQYKQAIVIRKDIIMSTGKSVVQGAHVSHLAADAVKESNRGIYDAWIKEGHAKIALRCQSLDELMELKRVAIDSGIVAIEIADMGKTQLAPGTITALAIGPADACVVDQVTGKLKLL